MNVVTINAAAFGYEIARPAKIKTSIPNPIVVQRGLLGKKNPVMIFSIPTNNKIIERNKTYL